MLTEDTIARAVECLSRTDPVLGELASRYGPPPLWPRPEGFRTLVHIVLEQKVSLASAQAVLGRVEALWRAAEPAAFLALPESDLREAGISERKLDYCRTIATQIQQGELDLAGLRTQSDEAVVAALVAVRGIGPWTASVYRAMALRRADGWVTGDRALALSVRDAWQLEAAPDYASLDKRASAWRPHRGTAARLLWHAYLQQRGRSVPA